MYQNKVFLVSSLKVFIFKTLYLENVEGADLKYDNMVFKLYFKNTQIRRH